MSELLNNVFNKTQFEKDYDTIHSSFSSTTNNISIQLPRGPLGIVLKYEDGWIVDEFNEDCTISNELQLGDKVIALNDIKIKDLTTNDIQYIFKEYQHTDRTILIQRVTIPIIENYL